jgi:6-phosphogluconate dehydrogenase
MQLGMIGLGRMGANMVRRLLRDGHECVVFDVSADAVTTLVSEGAIGATSMADFVGRLRKPRAAWMMVPAAVVDATLEQLVPLMQAGDIIVDGGNSYYRDDIERAKRLQAKGIDYLDAAA